MSNEAERLIATNCEEFDNKQPASVEVPSVAAVAANMDMNAPASDNNIMLEGFPRVTTESAALSDDMDPLLNLSVQLDSNDVVDDVEEVPDNNEPKKKEFHCLGVNLHLLPAKLFYLTFFGGLGCVFPYLSVYYRFVGLSARQTGILQAVRPFVLFFATPFWGIMGDKFQRTKLIWLISLTSLLVLTSLIVFVHPSSETLDLQKVCVCNTTVNTNSSTGIDITGGNDFSTICPSVKQHTIDARLDKFFPLMALVFVGAFFGSPAPSLADHFVIELLGDARRGHYGKQRLWGAVGWGLGAFGSGYASNSDSECTANYNIHFILFVAIFLVCVGFAVLIKPVTRPKVKVKVDNEVSVMKSLKALLVNPKMCVFLAAIWLVANFMAVIDNFLFWFLKDLGGGDVVIGLSLLFMCVGEVPVFIISGHIIGRIGHNGALYLTFICYILRFFLYSVLTNPWTVLPVELLHGVTFALMWATATSFAKENAPPNMSASSQTILSGVYWGFGRGCGGILSGLAWQQFGARNTFRACAVLSLVGGVLFYMAQWLLRWRKCEKKSRQLPVILSLLERKDCLQCDSFVKECSELNNTASKV